MQTLLPFHTAQRLVLDRIHPLEAERVALPRALGRVLAEPVLSSEMIPPFDNSAMDGFAVRSKEVAGPDVAYPIVQTIAAGGIAAALPEGSCARIMTGAPLPAGADAVIPVERALVSGERVRFEAAPSPGDHVRRAGENVRAGERILEAGIRITPPVVGMLATLGYDRIDVGKQPRVTVLATGDELVDASETPGPSQIRDANGPTLGAQISLAGGVVDGPRRVGDDRRRLQDALAAAATSADVLVVSGGVSMGEFDYVRAVLEDVGFEPQFWKVRQRPGKPLLFGLIGSMPVFGLPGNPVSASVCFELYVRPALALMQGRIDATSPLEKAILDEDIDKSPGLHHFVRGRLSHEQDGLHVAPTGPQGSHISRSLVLADCLIHLPEDQEDAPKGTLVDIQHLPWHHI